MNDRAATRPLSRWIRLTDLVCGLAAAALLCCAVVPVTASEPPRALWLELGATYVDTLRRQLALCLMPFLALLLVGRRPRRALLLAGLLLWAALPTLVWPSADRVPRVGAEPFRVVSVNLGGALARNASVLDLVRAREPDLLVLLEYTHARRRALEPELRRLYPHAYRRPRFDNFGMAVYAKQPWLAIEAFQLAATGTPHVRVETAVDGEPVVFYCVHVRPPKPRYYAGHRVEVADLLARLDGEAQPTVAVGDFNFVDHGALGAAFHARGLFDAQGLAGTGRGATWPVHGVFRLVPGIRIDHIYVGRGLTAVGAWNGARNGSDHLPIGADLVRAAEAR